MPRFLRLMSCLVPILGVFVLSLAHAGKPTPPPPPPPPDPATIYEWKPELGGWLDKSRNLIWGYTPTSFEGTNASYQWAVDTVKTNYATMLLNTAVNMQAHAQYCLDRSEIEFDLAEEAAAIEDWEGEAYHLNRAYGYLALRDRDLANIPEFQYAGAVASQYTNWRLPTKDEASDALNKGLFRYGPGGLNGYDCSPAVGNQETYRNWFTLTSTLKGTSVWVFLPDEETMTTVSKTQWCDFIPVRTYTPPSP